MKRGLRISAAAMTGLFLMASAASSQNYTISAKPGVVNYIEGTAYLNGSKLSAQAVRATFLSAGDVLSTSEGKAEVLLTPGVFLRIGDNSEIHMISPSLINTQVEIVRGEAIIEAAGLVKDNTVQVTDHGASISIEKNGLYRFKADSPPAAAVLEGKASVNFGEKKLELSKDHETILNELLKSEKFDPKQEDDLYAWSNVRSEYEAAASYQAAKSVSADSYGGGWGSYGYAGLYGPGWFWNSAFDSWAWLPANGAFYSPFGWGFYSPGVVGYAPVVTTPVYRGGHWDHKGQPGNPNWHHHWNGTSTNAAVPVRTDRPPAVGVIASSPWAAHEARVQAAHSLASTGAFNPGVNARTGISGAFAGGSHISTPGSTAVRGGGWSGSHAGSGGAGGWSGGSAGGRAVGSGGGWSGSHAGSAGGGGWSGGGHAGGGSSGAASGGGGGGHAGGGGSAGGGGGHH